MCVCVVRRVVRGLVLRAAGDVVADRPWPVRCWRIRSSIGRLGPVSCSALPRLHLRPIDVVVFHGPQARPGFEVGFPLRCLQRLSLSALGYPAVPLARQPVHQRCVHPGPLVLGTDPLKSRTPTADRDRTVSRRSKPSSRTTLIGEQPNPWDLLQPQDVMSRHRGAKPPRRCGLLGEISLLSPEYLLSVERWPFHAGPPDH